MGTDIQWEAEDTDTQFTGAVLFVTTYRKSAPEPPRAQRSQTAGCSHNRRSPPPCL